MSVRVRTIISSLNATSKKAFLKLIPISITPPDESKVSVKYPNALLTSLPKPDSYSMLGILTESILQHPISEINITNLFSELDSIHPLPSEKKDKITKSKTTKPFLDGLITTKTKLDQIIVGTPIYNPTILNKNVEGHPDIQTNTQLFEVKMTGQLEKNWTDFLLQAYSYAAISNTSAELYLVLPLQEQVISLQLDKWSLQNRAKWLTLMQSHAERLLIPIVPNHNALIGHIIQQQFGIGSHMSKLKSLVQTFLSLPINTPSQIFLGSPTSFRLSISDAELAEASSKIATRRVYIHTPYLINMCKDGKRDELLVRNIQYSVLLGCKGVVVHVGKSTTHPIEQALENMRNTIIDAITFATLDCPLLLETPAGQGTETLTDRELFLGFVVSFNDPRLAICLDTCHVYTCGHDPLEYLQRAYETGLLRLVHFNDSASLCGACVDRHAYIGTGHIGVDKMKDMASFCSNAKLDMVIE